MEAALNNLLSPMILAFGLGVLAGVFRSDLEIPESIAKGLSIYLMLAIGLKGGAGLAETPSVLDAVPGLIAALLLSFLMPFIAFALLRVLSTLPTVDRAAVAAHYGSVSVVTFATGAEFLRSLGVDSEGYVVAMLALMETPAIVTGLLLARWGVQEAVGASADGASVVKRQRLIEPDVLREVLLNGSIVLLVGGFLIGWATGPAGLEAVGPLFVDPFEGVLCLFLLDMGLLVARRFAGFSVIGPRLMVFGVVMPIIGATLGLGTGLLLGLSVGGVTLVMVLAASASYIAVPAAMRMALPQADPSVYVSLSLGVTFPFNIILGVPIYYWLAGQFVGA